ncbi:CatB-related O-acetyltransferase [Candidatus Galacturonibacter soehngenii]|nr:CatB-related O-acetyltransferase [Candidatus Galacturonibacter soehngenii]
MITIEQKIIIIGSTDLSEIAYCGLQLSDTYFRIVNYISDSNTVDTHFHDVKIQPLNHLVQILKETSFDLIFVFSEFETEINNLLFQLGVSATKIKNKDNISSYLTKPQIMLFLKEEIHLRFHRKYVSSIIHAGDFTYGVPLVLMDDDKTSLFIGKFCSIAHGVSIYLGGNHRSDFNTTYPFNMYISDYKHLTGHPCTKGDVRIGNDVWIGSDAKIMSGITIGDGCVIGANALVTKDIPPYSIVGGVPTTLIRKRFDDRFIACLEEMKWWDWDYEYIYDAIPFLQSNNYDALYDYYLERINNNHTQ